VVHLVQRDRRRDCAANGPKRSLQCLPVRQVGAMATAALARHLPVPDYGFCDGLRRCLECEHPGRIFSPERANVLYDGIGRGCQRRGGSRKLSCASRSNNAYGLDRSDRKSAGMAPPVQVGIDQVQAGNLEPVLLCATGCQRNRIVAQQPQNSIKPPAFRKLVDALDQAAVRDLARFPTETTSAARFGQSRPRSRWRSPHHCISRKFHV